MDNQKLNNDSDQNQITEQQSSKSKVKVKPKSKSKKKIDKKLNNFVTSVNLETVENQSQSKANTTIALSIWNDIKDKNIDLFGVSTKISNCCQFVPLDPSKCFLTYKVGGVIPAVETLFAGEYFIEQIGKYTILTRK